MLTHAAERLMEMEVEAATGKGTRTPARTMRRDGYREGGWGEADQKRRQ